VNSSLQNIVKELSVEEMSLLESLIKKIKQDKLTDLRTSPTLFKFVEEYKKYIDSFHSQKYLKSVLVSLKHLLNYFGEETHLQQLTVHRVEEFVSHISNEASKGYLVYLRNLKACFNRAVLWKYIPENPFNHIKIPKRQINKPLFITKDELNRILLYARSEKMKRIFLFAYHTGCRVSEIANLKWENINMDEELITVGDSEYTTKSRKQRIVPMNREIINIISQQSLETKRFSKYVFCKENGFPYLADYISKEFKKAFVLDI